MTTQVKISLPETEARKLDVVIVDIDQATNEQVSVNGVTLSPGQETTVYVHATRLLHVIEGDYHVKSDPVTGARNPETLPADAGQVSPAMAASTAAAPIGSEKELEEEVEFEDDTETTGGDGASDGGSSGAEDGGGA